MGKGAPREACSSRTRAVAAVSNPETAAGGGGAGGPAWLRLGLGPVGRAGVFLFLNNSAETEKNSRK